MVRRTPITGRLAGALAGLIFMAMAVLDVISGEVVLAVLLVIIGGVCLALAAGE